MALDNKNLLKEDMTKIKDKEYYATEFSEDSVQLKNLLLKMWDSGINTYACCAGHKKTKFRNRSIAYIFFDFRTISMKTIENMILLLRQKFASFVHFTTGIDKMKCNEIIRYGLAIYFEKNQREGFRFLSNIINKSDFQNHQISNNQICERDKMFIACMKKIRKLEFKNIVINNNEDTYLKLFSREFGSLSISHNKIDKIVQRKNNKYTFGNVIAFRPFTKRYFNMLCNYYK